MLQRIARLAITAPRRVIAVAALAMVAAGIFGIPVAKSLCACGFQDPTSESSSATQLLTEKFGQGDVQLLIIVSAADGFNSGPARAASSEIVDQLRRSPHVATVTSPWTAPPPAAAELVSKDGRSGLIVAGITGGESDSAEIRQGRCPIRWRTTAPASPSGRAGSRWSTFRSPSSRSATCC